MCHIYWLVFGKYDSQAMSITQSFLFDLNMGVTLIFSDLEEIINFPGVAEDAVLQHIH